MLAQPDLVGSCIYCFFIAYIFIHMLYYILYFASASEHFAIVEVPDHCHLSQCRQLGR